MAPGEDEVGERGIQRVVLIVGGKVHLPPGQEFHVVCRAEVEFLLAERVVLIHERGIGIEVAHVVVGILGIDLELVTVRHVLCPPCLGKEVPVPLALGMLPHVADDGTGDATLGVVIIGLGIPCTVQGVAKDGGLHTEGTYVAILAHCGGVPCHLSRRQDAAIAERVLARSPDIVGTEAAGDAPVPSLLPHKRGIDEAETASLQRGTEVVGLALLETRAAGADIHRARCAIVACRLEYLRLLSVVQGYLLHIVQGEAPKVNKAVLCIAQLYAVVEDAHVVGAHATDVYGLQASHTAVVLYLHAAEIAHGIGHGEGRQGLQALAAEALAGHYLLRAAGIDADLHHIGNAVQSEGGRVPLLGRGWMNGRASPPPDG